MCDERRGTLFFFWGCKMPKKGKDHEIRNAKIKFLAVDDVLEEFDFANADSIKTTIIKQISNSKLEVNRLLGLATDGASVMTGKRNGAAALLRRECKLFLNVHHICHRLALSCGEANDHVQYIQSVEKICYSFGRSSRTLLRKVLRMPRLLLLQINNQYLMQERKS